MSSLVSWRAASLLALAGALALAPSAHADRAFTPRFKANDTGDIVMAANTLLSCQDGAETVCADARAGKTGATVGNNSWNMHFVDVDSDPATFNSSRADIVLPADASILFAGLYWGANTTAGGATPRPSPRSGGARRQQKEHRSVRHADERLRHGDRG